MSKPNTKEFRALIEQGPAVALVAKDDMLKILDVLEAAQTFATSHHALCMADPSSQPHLAFKAITPVGYEHGNCHITRIVLLMRALEAADIDPFGAENVQCADQASTAPEEEGDKINLATTTPAGRA